jgi:dTDP-4-amino-4,6-dideoxygalactose transaminase
LIEDAAEALGGSAGDASAGSFGRAAALSFNGNKIMTTSGGGMLLSSDDDLIARARYLSTQARQPVPWYEHTEVGFNYRMSNILAALGRAQLSRLDAMITRRREIRERYAAALAPVEGVRLLDGGRSGAHEDNYWLTCIVVDPRVAQASAVIKELDAAGVEGRHLWKPMHSQPVFEGARSFVTGVSDDLFATGVTLPSGSGLSNDDIDRVLAGLLPALGAR